MNAMMLSCLKATEIMEIKDHVPIGLVKKIQLRMHVAMCSGCRNYMMQNSLINKLLHRHFESATTSTTDELEATIIKNIP